MKKEVQLSNKSKNRIVRKVNPHLGLIPLHINDQKESLWKQLAKESDLGLVILLYTAVEQTMRKVVESLLVEEKTQWKDLFEGGSGPLNTSSARRMLLEALGVIGKGMAKDIKYLAKIRNEFAHHIFESTASADTVSFETQKIVQWCNELIIPKIFLFDPPGFTAYYPAWCHVNAEKLDLQMKTMPSRNRFFYTAKAVCSLLEAECAQYGPMESPGLFCNYDADWASIPPPNKQKDLTSD